MQGVEEHDERVTIGAFARAAGVTTSALRFYDECGLVRPAFVDAGTGYRYYSLGQLDDVLFIRRLREAGLPLVDVRRVLDGPADEAEALLTRHLHAMEEAVAATRELLRGRGLAVRGALLAEAIGQVSPAAAVGGAFAVLGGVLFEAGEGEVRLVATDRYRLAIRSLRASGSAPPARATVAVARLAQARSWIAGQDTVRLHIGGGEVRLGDRVLPALPGEFPEYRAILDGLPEPVVRVVAPREALLRALGNAPTDVPADDRGDDPDAGIDLTVDGGLHVGGAAVPAEVSGGPMALRFQFRTLYPAVAASIGPDVLLRIAAPDLPVVVRSADDTDLTTLAMPTKTEEHA
ncbi:MerR family transcriptional regulator [Dactylosporangium sp. CA-052675]|uniref:DNA polymerase III subunit beta family protein n=1 Tax=Dactylosporangium sp. CA-052675 TaxID=3239927 RepID=UPI003D8CE57B